MIFKQVKWYISLQVVFLFVAITGAAAAIVLQKFIYLVVLFPLLVYLVTHILRFQLKLFEDLKQFVESIRYRDFTGTFSARNAPAEFKELRSGFNEINSVLKTLSREKETQYHYLQKVLEIVETGILFYDEANGDVIWMNESLKKMLRIPYLKKISSLNTRNSELYTEVMNVRPSQQGLVTIRTEDGSFKVLLSASNFHTEEGNFRLIAFQNVNEVLDETEAKAWQKLLSVLTHEIMNSIAPISSLANTLKLRVQQLNKPDDQLEDIEIGIDTIKRRSEGLLKFAETYRNLNKISSPALQKIFICELFENIYQLMQPMLNQKNIEMEIILKDTDLSIEADPALIEQVLINLVVNAFEAVKESDGPRVVLSAYRDREKIVMKVADNGTGIADDLLDQVFVPFFSTKKSGSGIGLTLCKQIMMLHRATIRIQSKANEGTAFLLHF